MEVNKLASGEVRTSVAGSPPDAMRFPINTIVVSGVLACSLSLSAAGPEADFGFDQDFDLGGLSALSLEQLMEVEVEIASKKAEPISAIPAAVSIITSEDIRRSAARTLPEILRQAAGVQVARQNGNYWAVSVRGFQDVFANKLLVLQDGRSLYTPLFSGTFWDVQDTVLADIDRIEIVRGPGGTVWGANAVNGVINIITKSAKDTLGTQVSVGYGSELQGNYSARYGAKLSEDLFIRLYGKYANHDNTRLASGDGANDGFYTGRGGFRMDWALSELAEMTLSGEVYGGKVNNTYSTYDPSIAFPAAQIGSEAAQSGVGGGHALGRYVREYGDATLTLQAYYDRSVRQTAIFDENRDTGDLELKYQFGIGARHQIVAGAGYRISSDVQGSTSTISFPQSERVTHLANAFIQDDISLIEDKLKLLLGTKLEHNQFTGVEVQPSARLHLQIATNQAAWLSVSRAVRTPSRVEDDVVIVSFNPTIGAVGLPTVLDGQRGIDSEKMLAYEAGYRIRATARFTLDVAAFYNQYDDLRSIELDGVGAHPAITSAPLVGAIFSDANGVEGEAYGVEISPSFQLQDWWRLTTSYSYLNMDLRGRPNSNDTITPREEDQSPDHTISIGSRMNLDHNVDLDVFARYVDQLDAARANNGQGAAVPSYWSLDARIGWHPKPGMEFSLAGQSLLDYRRPEFEPTFVSVQSTEIEHSVLAMLTYQF
jgi:iron complex outermembrane recepter protein